MMSTRRAEAGPLRPRRDPRVRRRRRRRAPARSRSTCSPSPTSAAPARRSGTRGRASCSRTCSASTRRLLRGEHARPRPGRAGEAGRGAAPAAAVRPVRRRRRGALEAARRRLLPAPRRRRRSPGRRARCTTASTAARPVVKARLSPDRRRPAGDDLRAGPARPVRAHLRLLRAHQLHHRRREDPHHAPRLRARHASWCSAPAPAPHYRDMISLIEHELAERAREAGAARRARARPRLAPAASTSRSRRR